MPMFVAGVFRVRLSAVLVIGGLFAAVVALQVTRQHRAEEKREIVADAQFLNNLPTSGFGLEQPKESDPAPPATASHDQWKAYCYHERATLIAEATGGSE